MPGFPEEQDGMAPWQDEEGVWRSECPWPDLKESVEMIRHHENWQKGHTPRSLGWAESVPRLFAVAINAVEAFENECRSEAEARLEAKAKRG